LKFKTPYALEGSVKLFKAFLTSALSNTILLTLNIPLGIGYYYLYAIFVCKIYKIYKIYQTNIICVYM
jgi:hypothetical protein